MKLQQIGELTALIAAHSRHVIDCPTGIPESTARDFWDHSRKHAAVWMAFLRDAGSDSPSSSGAPPQPQWEQVERVFAEIFAMEMLSRVWCTILTAADRKCGVASSESYVNSVVAGQRQVRNLALSLMVHWSQDAEQRLALIDRIRRRVERWTDSLIGYLAVTHHVLDFAFEPTHALDFGRNALDNRPFHSDSPMWQLIVSGLRISFPASLPEMFHRNEVGQTVRTIIGTFPAELQQDGAPFALIAGELSELAETALCEVKSEPPMVLPFATQPQNAGDGGLNVSRLRENFRA